MRYRHFVQTVYIITVLCRLSYIKAIAYFRVSDLNNAISNIDKLLALKPNDPFYHELKGQILFEFGKKEALNSYAKAAQFRPNDLLIKLGHAVVGINLYINQPEKMHKFYNDLQLITDKEADNLLAYYYLAIYCEKTKKLDESLLNSAIIAYKTGDLPRAKTLAKQAIKTLKINTPNWYKANDIILTKDVEH